MSSAPKTTTHAEIMAILMENPEFVEEYHRVVMADTGHIATEPILRRDWDDEDEAWKDL